MRILISLFILFSVYIWFKLSPETQSNIVSATKNHVVPGVEKKLSEIKLSDLKHKDISLEKLKEVMASTFEGKSHIPADIMREMEVINQDWIPYRDRIYESMDLSRDEWDKLFSLRSKYKVAFENLSEKLQNASGADKENWTNSITLKKKEFDKSLIRLLGEEKFQYLLEGRNRFNEDLDRVHELRPRISTNW